MRDANVVVLDIRSAIDGGGDKAYEAAHIPGSIHSDYDKAGWRVTRNNVALMVPTAPELEKLIAAKHYPLFPDKVARSLPRLDRRSFEAGMTWIKIDSGLEWSGRNH